MLSILQNKGAPNKNRILFLLVMALLLISGFLLFNAPKQTEFFYVKFPSGGVLKAEVADTPEKLLFGLAFRNALPPNEAMIYIFENSGLHRVWTKEFQFPVDVIWVDESKIVVHIVERALPCSERQCPWYGPPPQDARYIVEANAGFVDQAKIKIGAQVTFTLLVS